MLGQVNAPLVRVVLNGLPAEGGYAYAYGYAYQADAGRARTGKSPGKD